ncbi:MAG: TraI/MobA(P) family conjugative relaxase [Methylococcaceae bacterium]
MIAKHIAMQSIKKSSFAELARYIVDEQSMTERVGVVRLTNCQADALEDAIIEVVATQMTNRRSLADKTYHLLLSFRAGEKPDPGVLAEIEERFCSGLGYAEHQRISAVHRDTDNVHIHIAINKIHPQRHTIHEPFSTYRTLADLCRSAERDYGLEHDNHQARRGLSECRAADMERHSGIESLVSWIRHGPLAAMRAAATWAELHGVMAENGLALKARGNGFVMVSLQTGVIVKASTIARDLSRTQLEARLGPYLTHEHEAGAQGAARSYRADPIALSVDTTALYARYTAEQQSVVERRSRMLSTEKSWRVKRIAAAQSANRSRRAAIKILGDDPAIKKLLYAQARQSLRDEITAINARHRKGRTAVSSHLKKRTWADWLRHEAVRGNADALLALRAREGRERLGGDTLQAAGEAGLGQRLVIDGITKKGTIIYRAQNASVRDDGERLRVQGGAGDEVVRQALRLAMQRGNRITVNGSVAFKAQAIQAAVDAGLSITFADPAMERQRALLLTEVKNGRQNAGPRSVGDSLGTGTTQKKPDIGGIGREPPPQSQNRLQRLSDLGVVRIASGSEVLLQGDVTGDVEQRRAQSADPLRRAVFGAGISDDHITAMETYIAEREAKCVRGFDIKHHVIYNGNSGAVEFGGIRNVDGHPLALLRQDDQVMVMPVTLMEAQRLSRIAVGEPVSVAEGSIKKRSRGRRR